MVTDIFFALAIAHTREMEYLADYITKPFSEEDLVEVVKQFDHIEIPITG